jgi:DNA-binding Lrp family transcriptional regulator
LVKDVQGVLEVNLTTGIYDMILKLQADDEHQLEEVVKGAKAISGVTSTMTSIVYKADSFAPSSTKQ